MLLSGAAAAVLLLAGAAQAADQVQYGPTPAWVKPVEPVAEAPADAGGTVQVLLLDSQTRLVPEGELAYVRVVAKITQPAGLQELGSITLSWDPATTAVTVNRLHIIRDGRVIDALASDKFTVLRRESNLERAMLDGALTGTIQLKGLQVGDVVDYALTQTHRDPVLAGRSQGDYRLPIPVVGKAHYSLKWPKSEKIQWRASPEMGTPKLTETAEGTDLEIEGLNLPLLRAIDGAPDQFNPQRRLEVTEFADWAEVSALMAPLYAKAQILAPNSPLKAEAAKIRAASDDPKTRAEMALKLVQEQVRYVFIGMDSGGWVPATADETWTRRFGDCKGKTVLLLALLNELGVKAEPVAVNTVEGAGLDQRLPGLGAFNHVLVRADLGGGMIRWLDGTRVGDRDLTYLTPPPFRWGLPVRAQGATLEPIGLEPALLPYAELTLRIDAREGLDKPMKVFGETRLRDDQGAAMQRGLSALSKDEAERVLREGWKEEISWIEPDSAGWSYDEATGVVRVWFEGTGEDDWYRGEDKTKRAFEVDNSGLSGIGKFKRDKSQPKDTPFAVGYPAYDQWLILVQLPDGGEGFTVTNQDVEEEVAGVSVSRSRRLQDGVLVVQRAERALKPEITAEEAEAARTRGKSYPNATVWVEKPVAPPAGMLEVVSVPTDADGLMRAGWAEMRKERPEKALPLFDKALKLDPDQAWAVKGRAAVFALREDTKRALREFDNALKRKPASGDLYLWKAQVLYQTGDKAGAIATLTEGLDKAEVKTGLREQRLEAYLRTDDLDRALADADETVKLAPRDGAALRMRSYVHMKAKRYDQALADANAALALQPYAGASWSQRGAVLVEQGRFEAARADYRRALQIDPLDTGAMNALAEIAMKTGRPEDAGAQFDAGLELAPGSALLLNGRCWTRVMADRDLDKAQADCDAALKIAPKAAAVLDSRAWVSLRQGQWDDAIARFDAALKVAPKLAASLYGRGLAKLRKGDAAGGERDLAAARAILPKVDEEFVAHGLKP